jgi:catechol 2,3-dioxygenase-like lactoylglutathione lyase family enzyme
MLDHVSIGVRDLKRSQEFYDAVLGVLGYERLSNDDGSLGYGDKLVGFWVYASEHPVARNKKSGLHFCFTASSRQRVSKFHAAALENGGERRARASEGLRAALLRRVCHRSRWISA